MVDFLPKPVRLLPLRALLGALVHTARPALERSYQALFDGVAE